MYCALFLTKALLDRWTVHRIVTGVLCWCGWVEESISDGFFNLCSNSQQFLTLRSPLTRQPTQTVKIVKPNSSTRMWDIYGHSNISTYTGTVPTLPDTSASVKLYLLVRVHAVRESVSLEDIPALLLEDQLGSFVLTRVSEGSSLFSYCWRALRRETELFGCCKIGEMSYWK